MGEEEDTGVLRFRYAIAQSAAECADIIQAKAIIFFCEQFEMAVYLAKLRPSCPLFVATFDPTIASGTQGLYGCHGILLKEDQSIQNADDMLKIIEKRLLSLAGKEFEEATVVLCAHRCVFPSLHNTVRMACLGMNK